MVTAKDFSFMKRAAAWIAPDALPVRFQYGDRMIEGWPQDAAPAVTERRQDGSVTCTTTAAALPDGLEIRVECVQYDDYPVAEYTAYLTNRGQQDSKIVDSLRVSCHIASENAILYHGNGDTCGTDGYTWRKDPLPLTMGPVDGTSCKGAFPYMRLILPEGMVSLALGWPTQWEATFAQDADGVRIEAGQKHLHTLLHPGETIRTPRLTMQFVTGDNSRAINMWRRWYFAHVLPTHNGKKLAPKYCLHYWMCEGKPEFTAATEENQLRALDEYVKHGLIPDVWWFDAGWYPCDYNWTLTGTWTPDPARFPNGLGVISDAARRQGADMLLWFEPERVQKGTWLDLNHPEWLLKRTLPDGSLDNDRLLNLGDPKCCDSLIEYVSNFLKDNHITIYRQDFNFNPEPFWRQNETEDRVGLQENLHGQGYLRYWDGLRANVPGLLLDSCASGGRRNDMETMRRAVPLHYTDVGYGDHPIKQLQHRQMFEWIPYFRAHNMNWVREDGTYSGPNLPADEYAYQAALAPCMTDMTFFNATEEQFAQARHMVPVWRKAAQYMLDGDFYPLTECRADAHDFYAMQFHVESTGEGFANVMRNSLNPESTFILKLNALDAGTEYILTDGYHGGDQAFTGAQLAEGIKVELQPKSGVTYFYHKKA